MILTSMDRASMKCLTVRSTGLAAFMPSEMMNMIFVYL